MAIAKGHDKQEATTMTEIDAHELAGAKGCIFKPGIAHLRKGKITIIKCTINKITVFQVGPGEITFDKRAACKLLTEQLFF